MPVIACTSRGDYFAAMLALLFRLLALGAVMLMPIGMNPVAAATIHQPTASAAATMEHCAKHSDQPQHKSMHRGDCAGCVAVAAFPAPIVDHGEEPAIAPYRALADLRLGLILEIATPPPKRS